MTRAGAGTIFILLLALLCSFVLGCSGCRRDSPLATLAEKGGTVERDHAGSVGAWKGAAPGAELFVGEGVRTAKVSTASLSLGDGSRLALKESTLVRFLARPPGAARERFELEMGEAEVVAGSKAMSLETDFGVAVVEAGSRLVIRRGPSATRYEVSVGKARFEPRGGAATEVSAGEGISVGIGTAVLERISTAPAASATPSATPPAPSALAPFAADAGASVGGVVKAQVSSAGATVRAPGATAFAPLPRGASDLEGGSTLRLPAGATAEIQRGAERATLRGAGEFVVGGKGGSLVQAHSGGVSLTGASGDVKVSVPGGSIVARAGATAEVKIQKDQTKVSVQTGEVSMVGESGNETLGAGEEGTLGKGGTEVVGRGPGYKDFVVGAGESFAVHDPKPPVAVAFSVGATCPGTAQVEIVGRPAARSRGTGSVSVLFPAGASKYQVRCVSDAGELAPPSASGSVSVLRDSGTARIPRTAPATAVDADGRSYTVLYQNLLPKITVKWPGAPAGGGYSLSVASPGGATASHSAASPMYTFASGALREGVHRVTFQGGGTRSKATTVDIRFDNATPTATLTSPANGSFGPGGSVTVAGVVLEGWQVSVAGQALPLDGQLRFSGTVTAPGGQRALPIRLTHPRRGVHYYLRRTSGS